MTRRRRACGARRSYHVQELGVSIGAQAKRAAVVPADSAVRERRFRADVAGVELDPEIDRLGQREKAPAARKLQR
jgi:hypothetical protein